MTIIKNMFISILLIFLILPASAADKKPKLVLQITVDQFRLVD